MHHADTLRESLRTHKDFTKERCFYLNCNKFSIKSYRGDSNTHPQHMILWRNIKIIHFYHFDSDPRFPPFLLYVRWKSEVTFVRRCFRDDVYII